MFRPVEVKSLSDYRIWLRYADGTQGEVDLSHLADKGVFKIWNTPGMFEKVHIGEHGEIAWDDVDLCPDALYLELTGKKPEEVFPNLKGVGADA